MLYRFHVNLFALHSSGQPFHCTWEQAAQSLESLPRMMFEPDGSWIFSGGFGKNRWQVDGHLFDFDERLHRVELHGQCPPESFDALLACFGWPETELIFEQVLEGVRLRDAEFRRAASMPG
jgi:hypothetical protein